ncbi:hypothetical protein [Actinomyces vulturis]|uniref:hypothetical protein n=1 Tax=Actinomyces vulturis TaxID=1857645 RepID=UPI00082CF78D|nr:hypothetical protein [Actinomyces vulturis]
MNKRMTGIFALAAVASAGLSGTASAFWHDTALDPGAGASLARTSITVETPLTGIEGATGESVQSENFTHTYTTTQGTLTAEQISQLTTGSHELAVPISFTGSSTPHRSTNVIVDSQAFKDFFEGVEGAQVHTGWLPEGEECSVANVEKLIDQGGKLTDSDATGGKKTSLYCMVATLPSETGENGTYTNVGTVNATTTGEDGEPMEISASDSWTTDFHTITVDYSELAKKLEQPAVSVTPFTSRLSTPTPGACSSE